MSPERLVFAHDGGALSVPVAAITAVSWRAIALAWQAGGRR